MSQRRQRRRGRKVHNYHYNLCTVLLTTLCHVVNGSSGRYDPQSSTSSSTLPPSEFITRQTTTVNPQQQQQYTQYQQPQQQRQSYQQQQRPNQYPPQQQYQQRQQPSPPRKKSSFFDKLKNDIVGDFKEVFETASEGIDAVVGRRKKSSGMTGSPPPLQRRSMEGDTQRQYNPSGHDPMRGVHQQQQNHPPSSGYHQQQPPSPHDETWDEDTDHTDHVDSDTDDDHHHEDQQSSPRMTAIRGGIDNANGEQQQQRVTAQGGAVREPMPRIMTKREGDSQQQQRRSPPQQHESMARYNRQPLPTPSSWSTPHHHPTQKPIRPPPYSDDDDDKFSLPSFLLKTLTAPLALIPTSLFSKLTDRDDGRAYLSLKHSSRGVEGWDADDDRHETKSKFGTLVPWRKKRQPASRPPPVAISESKFPSLRPTLLSSAQLRHCRSLGTSLALCETLALGFLRVALSDRVSFSRLWSNSGSWSTHALAAGVLLLMSTPLLFSERDIQKGISLEVASQIDKLRFEASLYSEKVLEREVLLRDARWYARLRVREAVMRQRMTMGIVGVIVVMFMGTATMDGMKWWNMMGDMVVNVRGWEEWPGEMTMEEWKRFGLALLDVISPWGNQLMTLLQDTVTSVSNKDILTLAPPAIFISILLLLLLLLPPLSEPKQQNPPLVIATTTHDFHSSIHPSTRLRYLSSPYQKQMAMTQYQIHMDAKSQLPSKKPYSSVKGVLRHALLLFTLSPPLILHYYAPSSTPPLPITILLLVYLHHISSTALHSTLRASYTPLTTIPPFLSHVVTTLSTLSPPPPSRSITPQGGGQQPPLLVTDLWMAHTHKKAWALRGLHLRLTPGLNLLLQSSSSTVPIQSSTSTILRGIAEMLIVPPPGGRSLIPVRGGVRVNNGRGDVVGGGRGVVGVVLEGEGLPWGGEGCLGEFLGGRGGESVRRAMEITNLPSTLLQHLPSSLNTIISSSHSTPHTTYLPPPQQTQILLTATIAHLLQHNHNTLENTILLLDDCVTSHLSERDEARLLERLRSCGATVLMSSKRWSMGRYADRIVVLDEGGRVREEGTHEGLVRRREGVYEERWREMMGL